MPGNEPPPHAVEGPAPAADRGEEPLLRMCSWCRRIEVDGRWVEAETVATTRRPAITHGMCEACYRAVASSIPRKD